MFVSLQFISITFTPLASFKLSPEFSLSLLLAPNPCRSNFHLIQSPVTFSKQRLGICKFYLFARIQSRCLATQNDVQLISCIALRHTQWKHFKDILNMKSSRQSKFGEMGW